MQGAIINKGFMPVAWAIEPSTGKKIEIVEEFEVAWVMNTMIVTAIKTTVK